MPYFVVTTEKKTTQIVEAPDKGTAFTLVPGADSVRNAMSHERRAYLEAKEK